MITSDNSAQGREQLLACVLRISHLLERLRARVQERVAINWSTALGTGFLHGLATIMMRVMKALFLTATIALTRQQRRLSDSRSLRGS